MTRMIVILAATLGLVSLSGCGSSTGTAEPMTEEQVAKMRAHDLKIDEDEMSGAGTATPAKKRRR